jgi:hypothetical protein
MLFWVTNDDRAKLALIPRAQDFRIEGNGLRQLGDVMAIDRAIAGQLQGQIMRFQREQPQTPKLGKEPRQTLRVRLG